MQQHISQQRHPHVPVRPIKALPQEIPQFETMLHFPEEHLNGALVPLQLRYGVRAPFQVIGQEHHLNLLAVQVHQGHQTAQDFGILRSAAFSLQHNLVIPKVRPGRSTPVPWLSSAPGKYEYIKGVDAEPSDCTALRCVALWFFHPCRVARKWAIDGNFVSRFSDGCGNR